MCSDPFMATFCHSFCTLLCADFFELFQLLYTHTRTHARTELVSHQVRISSSRVSFPDSQKSSSGCRFYMLAPVPLESSRPDTPKVDGLACSFLLSTPDVLTYSALYDAVMSLLPAGALAPSKSSSSLLVSVFCLFAILSFTVYNQFFWGPV